MIMNDNDGWVNGDDITYSIKVVLGSDYGPIMIGIFYNLSNNSQVDR